MHRNIILAVLVLQFFASWHNAASCDEAQAIAGPSKASIYLHLLGTNRAKNHDPDDWRPDPDDQRLPRWSCVATLLVHNNRKFYLRAPGNREPYVKLSGLAVLDQSGIASVEIEYELDDSNMTYIKTETFKVKLDHFIYLADGIYWRAILSRNDDAYEAFDSAQKNQRLNSKSDRKPCPP